MKKLNLLLLTFMLIMNSLIGVTPVAFAEDGGGYVEEIQEIELEERDAISESVTEIQPETYEGEEQGSGDVSNASLEEGDAEDIEVLEEDVVKEEDSTMSLSSFEDQEFDVPVSVIDSTEFTIGNQVVIGKGPFTVENGQTAKFKLNLEQVAGHNYGEGSKLTYTLPEIFNGVEVSEKVGSVGSVTHVENVITITFNDAIHDGFNGTAFGEKSTADSDNPEPAFISIEAKFNSLNNNIDETFSLPGEDDIKLNFTPKTGKPITKENGTPRPGTKNSEYIEWEVTVNTDLKAKDSGMVDFVDTLTPGHKFDLNTNVKITELVMKADGTSTPGATTTQSISDEMEMSLNLDGKKAYKIVYRTIPDDPGNATVPVTYKNSAVYNNSTPVSKNATITYSSPLEKKVSKAPSGADLVTEWQIQYNLNKRPISQGAAVLTDSWTSDNVAQKLLDFEVFEADADGNATTTKFTNFDMTPVQTSADDVTGFKLQFKEDIDSGYVIKYKTEPSDPTQISGDFSVENTVKREDIDLSKPAEQKYSTKTFALNKTAGAVDYHAKTIKWSITANQAKQSLVGGAVFIDTFKTENMTLNEGTLVVIAGDDLVRDTGYTLDYIDNTNKKLGFKVTLVNGTSEQINISYTTEYDIKDIGKNPRDFENKVILESTSLPSKPSDTAKVTGSTKQKANGEKSGKYDYATQEFEWDVLLNYNYNTFTNAIFEDELPDTQKVTEIKVYEGKLNTSGVFVPNAGDPTTYPAPTTEPNKIYLDLGLITTPHKVVYKSKDSDGVFPANGSKVTITNKATLTQTGEPLLSSDWKKTVGINYTDKLIDKKGAKQAGSGIKWDFKFNYAQSDLKDVVITDSLGVDGDGSPDQIIDPDTFKVFKVTLTGTTSDPAGTGGTAIPVETTDYDLNIDITTGKFTLKLPDGKQAYHVEYETTYFGPSGDNSNATNTVHVEYNSTEGTSASQDTQVANFTYANAGSTTKVPFVVIKTDGETGLPMEGVKFTLYSKFNPTKPLISKETDENGVFDLGMKLTETEYTLVETKVDEYDKAPDKVFNLKAGSDSVAISGPYKDKQIVDIENFKTGYIADCTEFKLTIKDVDGNPVANKEVVLTNKETGKQQKVTTGNSGEVTLLPAGFKVADYTVTTTEGGTTVTLGDVTVTYDGDCEAKVIQPVPKCDNFTVTILTKDGEENIPRPHVEVTLKHTDEISPSITETTDEEGKFLLPSGTTKTGKYTVYEGNQYLGEVTITYKKTPCEATIIEAPSCDVFTLTVNDVDGNPRKEGVVIKIKDKEGTIIETLTTDSGGKVKTNNPLPAGEYDVYEGDSVTPFAEFKSNIDCAAEVQPAPCSDFTIALIDKEGDPLAGVKVILKGKDKNGDKIEVVAAESTDEDGKVRIPSKNLPAGKYKLYQGDVLLGEEIDVSYKDGTICSADVGVHLDVIEPVCEDCTVTLFRGNGQPYAGVPFTFEDPNGDLLVLKDEDGNDVLVKDEDGNPMLDEDGNQVPETLFTTSAEGKVTFGKSQIKAGVEYTAYENGVKKLGTFTIEDECDVSIIPSSGGGGGGWLPPTTCDAFTITVTESGVPVEAGVRIVLKDGSGKEVANRTTSADGKVAFAQGHLPAGTYTVHKADGTELGTVEVTYDEGDCQATVDLPAKSCDRTTVTITNKPNTPIEIVDASGKVIFTGMTDKTGVVVVSKPVPQGDYTVVSNGEKLGTITITDSCSAVVIVDGEDPKDPNDKDPAGPNGGDPNRPGGDGSGKPTDPNNPNDSNTNGPGKPGTGNGSGQNGEDGSSSGQDKDKLPQTGEARNMNMIIGGILSIMIGSSLIFFRRKQQTV